jgi:hypothetical protein
MTKLLRDTFAASTYLKERRGLPRSPAYLRKLRCTGGGPKFRRFNGKPYYEEDDLDAWVDEGLSAPMSSTSEPEGSGAHRRSRRQAEAKALEDPAKPPPLRRDRPRRQRAAQPAAEATPT